MRNFLSLRSMFFALCALFFVSQALPIYAQSAAKGKQTAALRSCTIATEPKATVWLDGVRFGAAGENGNLTIKTVPAGTHTLRVRAGGFKEVSQPLLPTQKGIVKVALVKTTDEAELAFQQAESVGSDSEKAIELYNRAIKLRPKYAEAYVGLARVLSSSGDPDEALKTIGAARKIRPGYAEASAVEGRIYKDNENEEKAIASFKRAITEGKNFQPEAFAGLGLLYRDRAEGFNAKGDFEQEKAAYGEAAKYLQSAVRQLSGAPDAEIIYQLLGLIYEKTENPAQAIKTYEEFLRIFPNSTEAEAVRSFIVQLKKQINGQ